MSEELWKEMKTRDLKLLWRIGYKQWEENGHGAVRKALIGLGQRKQKI